ncbi:MAG: hypothetical protein E4H02_01840 [Lentisphaerales bacterium]|nr:MAG: hypothetical protein E4H02_01840 [Lentisphaerales bacterium]
MKTMISVAGSFVLAMLIVGCEGGGDDGGSAVVLPDCEGITDIGELALCMPDVLTKLSTRTGWPALKGERSTTSCSVRESKVSSSVSFWS